MIGKAHTVVTDRPDYKAIHYHSTLVFQWEPGPWQLRLYHGGWVTATTARRINQGLLTFDLPGHSGKLADRVGLVRRIKGGLYLVTPSGTRHPIGPRGLVFDVEEMEAL